MEQRKISLNDYLLSIRDTNPEIANLLTSVRAKHTLSDIVHDFSDGYKEVINENKFFNPGNSLNEIYTHEPYLPADNFLTNLQQYINSSKSDSSAKKNFRDEMYSISATLGNDANYPCLAEFEQYRIFSDIDFKNNDAATIEKVINRITKDDTFTPILYLDAQFGNVCDAFGRAYTKLTKRKANFIIDLAYMSDPASKWSDATGVYNRENYLEEEDTKIFEGGDTGLQTCTLNYSGDKLFRKWNGADKEEINKKDTSVGTTLKEILNLSSIKNSVAKQLKIISKTSGDRFQTISLKDKSATLISENKMPILVTNDYLELYDAWWHKIPYVLFTTMTEGVILYEFVTSEVPELSDEDYTHMYSYISENYESDIKPTLDRIIEEVYVTLKTYLNREISRRVIPAEILVIFLNCLHYLYILNKTKNIIQIKKDIITKVLSTNDESANRDLIRYNIQLFKAVSKKSSMSDATYIDNLKTYFGIVINERFNLRYVTRALSELGEDYKTKFIVLVYGFYTFINNNIVSQGYTKYIVATILLCYYKSGRKYAADLGNPRAWDTYDYEDKMKLLMPASEVELITELIGEDTIQVVIQDIINALIRNEKPDYVVEGGGKNILKSLKSLAKKTPEYIDAFELYDSIENIKKSSYKSTDDIYYEYLYKERIEEVKENSSDVNRELIMLNVLFTSKKREEQILETLFEVYQENYNPETDYYTGSIYNKTIPGYRVKTPPKTKSLKPKFNTTIKKSKKNLLANNTRHTATIHTGGVRKTKKKSKSKTIKQ